MIIDQSLPEDLPLVVQRQLIGFIGEAWRAIMSGELSPAQAEEKVVEFTRQMGQELLSTGLSERHGKHEGCARACPCGQGQRFVNYRERRVMTLLGPVRFRRAYYYCLACGATHYRGDEALGIEDGSGFSLPAQEAICLVSAETTFERTRFLLGRLSGLHLSISHAQHVSQKHGAAVASASAQTVHQLFAGQIEHIPEDRNRRLYVTLDATKTRFVDDWHETKVGACYTVKPGRKGLDEPDRTTYVTEVEAGLEGFGQALYDEAARRGVQHAAETVVVADGAPWIWNLVAEHFPDAIQILDFYHASERLHTVSKAVYGDGCAKAREWADRSIERLHVGDWKGLLCSLKALRPTTVAGQETVRLALGYFATNRQRMDYPRYRARGMHIGSGVVEAACKHVVGTRCKRAGQRWTKPGAGAILDLRCLSLNGRWDEYWQPLKMAS
jgi:hypothetical protein